jgi:hypothetical protein
MSTTVTAPAPARADARATYDRLFYSGMAMVMALTVLIGFAPTYYLRPFFAPPVTVSGSASLTLLTLVHGALFTGWVLLFIAQTALIKARRVALHRRVGTAGAVLAAAMVIVGVSTALDAAGRGAAPPGVDPLVFLAVPLFDMVLFAGFVTAAVRWRRDKEAHKRLMLLAYISIIVAAVARFPGVLPLGPLVFFGLAFIFVLVAAAYDFATRRRVHPVYVWGGAVIAISVPLRLAISGTAAWRAFAEFLVA